MKDVPWLSEFFIIPYDDLIFITRKKENIQQKYNRDKILVLFADPM